MKLRPKRFALFIRFLSTDSCVHVRAVAGLSCTSRDVNHSTRKARSSASLSRLKLRHSGHRQSSAQKDPPTRRRRSLAREVAARGGRGSWSVSFELEGSAVSGSVFSYCDLLSCESGQEVQALPEVDLSCGLFMRRRLGGKAANCSKRWRGS